MYLFPICIPANADVFSGCMDPPHTGTVADALSFLRRIEALQEPQRAGKGGGLPVPTPYGKLLVSLPLDLEAAMLVVRGCAAGFLRESVVLAVILDSSPAPIVQPFGKREEVRGVVLMLVGFVFYLFSICILSVFYLYSCASSLFGGDCRLQPTGLLRSRTRRQG